MRVPGWQAAPSCLAHERLGIEPRALRTLGEHDIPSSYLPFFIHASSSYVSILPPPPKPSGLRLLACLGGVALITPLGFNFHFLLSANPTTVVGSCCHSPAINYNLNTSGTCRAGVSPPFLEIKCALQTGRGLTQGHTAPNRQEGVGSQTSLSQTSHGEPPVESGP